MAWGKVDAFDDEVKYQVGQRVRVLIGEDVIPKENVICNTGVIRSISTPFFATPERRRFLYRVALDGKYFGSIGPDVSVDQKKIIEVLKTKRIKS